MTTTIGIVRRTRQLRQSGPIFAAQVPGFDVATLAWVAAVIAAGGTVSNAREILVDNLIRGLKSDGVWTKLDRLWIHAMENQTEALVDMVADASATAVNSPTFTTNRGFTGSDADPATIYIDTGLNTGTAVGLNYVQNSAHLSMWSVTNTAATAGGCEIGNNASSPASDADIFDTFTDGNLYAGCNDVQASQGAPTTRAGHWITSRTGASASKIYQNGSGFTTPNATSAAVPNFNVYILARNAAGSAARGSPNQVAMASIGGGLTDTDATNFYNRLRTYMTAVGVP